jgi:signal transduction histidine kinase
MKRRASRWPISVKVPVAVASLMLLVGVVVSERVLNRLAETQERHLSALSQSYLDGLSSAIAPAILREDSWEVFDAIGRLQDLHKGLRPIEAVVANADGAVIASSQPRRYPIGTTYKPAHVASPEGFSFEAGADTASAVRILSYPGRVAGIIYVTFDTRHLAAERRDVLMALLVTNGLLTLVLAAAGWFLVSYMMRPVRILTEHLGAARESSAARIPDDAVKAARGEFRQLFRSYNALVHSIDEREILVKRLADEERLGSLGRLASTLAHEINNPLGGLFNALATLKTHGHLAPVRESSLALLDRGLIGIRDVVRSTLAIYRVDRAPRDLSAEDIADLNLLVGPEARRKSVRVVFQNGMSGTTPLPSTPVRQIILNLLLNAIAAAPVGSEVELTTNVADDRLVVTVSDHGPGLPEFAADLVARPLPTPIPSGGLGLWTVRKLLNELSGSITIHRAAETRTVVTVEIPFRRQEGIRHVA